MADTPTIARWTDVINTAMELPGFMNRKMSTAAENAFIRFEGDTAPRSFRGEGISRTWSLRAIFWRTQHYEAQSLIAMFEAAHAAADPRLYFDHGGQMAEIVPYAFPVVVSEWDFFFDPPGSGIAVIDFELVEVA